MPSRSIPEVIKIAKDHFNVKESKNLRLHAQDGRLFLTRTPESIRYHPARRLFHRRHAVSSGDQRIFRIGAAQTHAQRHRRRQFDQRGHRTVRQNRALAFVRTQRQIFPQTYVFAARRPDNVSLERFKTSSSLPPAISNASISKRSSSAPRRSTKVCSPIPSKTSRSLI